MERTNFLQMCQKVSVLKSGVLGIKENVPDDLKVIHNGIVYYPVAYELSFDNGQPTHTAILHDLHANSICYAMLEGVSELNKEEVIKLIKRNRNPRNEAITLIADFLVLKKDEAEKIYIEEFEK